MKPNELGFDSPEKPLYYSTVLPSFRSTGLFDSKSGPPPNNNSSSKNSNFLVPIQNKSHIKEAENYELTKLKADFEYLKEESAHEQVRLYQELKDAKEKNNDLEKRHMMMVNDLDKQSLLFNEKLHEIDYWKNKFSNIEASFSQMNSEKEKISRMNNDINEVAMKWKEKYNEFEKVYLEQQNQFEALKIKYKRLEKKNELIEMKEIYHKQEISNNNLQSENEKLRKNFNEFELKQQKYMEEMESLQNEFSEYKANHDTALEETRNEGSKMIQDMHVAYQEVLHKKLQTENQTKYMMDQMKEMSLKTQKQDGVILEKENKILEMELKLNEAEKQISELNFLLNQKDQNLFKMKTEFTGASDNNFGIKSQTEGPGVRILEARAEKQQAEILSLKKTLEYNEKFKSNEKFIETIKIKEKECEILKEKIRKFEYEEPIKSKKFEALINDLKIKIVLISSENERLHALIKQVKNDKEISTKEYFVETKNSFPNYKYEGKYDFQNNQENETTETRISARAKPMSFPNYNYEGKFDLQNNNENESTSIRLSARTKPIHDHNREFLSPTYRDQNIPVDFYSPTYRPSNQSVKRSVLIKDYEESNKQLQALQNQLQDSLRKKETYFSHFKYPNYQNK